MKATKNDIKKLKDKSKFIKSLTKSTVFFNYLETLYTYDYLVDENYQFKGARINMESNAYTYTLNTGTGILSQLCSATNITLTTKISEPIIKKINQYLFNNFKNSEFYQAKKE